MNKHYLLLFSLAMLGSLSASSVRAQGPALENGYYQVSNISELYWIAEQVNSGELSGNVNVKVLYNLQDNETYTYWDQMKDIAHGNTAYTGSEGLQLWTPIGTEEHPYSGIFDGGGNTITGLFMAPDAPNYGGIFGVIYDATIENVSSYENALVGKKAAGTIVGKMTGGSKVMRCYVSGSIINAIGTGDESEEAYAGGIVGEDEAGCVVSHCLYYNVSDDPEVMAVNDGNRAGIIGHSQGSIIRCVAVSGRGDTEMNAICPQVANTEGCYYDKDTFTNPESGSVTGTTWADFNSGRICYLLNQGLADDFWYQEIHRIGYCIPVPYPGYLGFTQKVVKLPCGLYVNEPAEADTPYDFIALNDSILVTLAEGQTIKAYEIDYSREIDPETQWHSVCLPFDIKTSSSNGFFLYTFRDLKIEEGDSTLYLSPVDVLPANAPGFCTNNNFDSELRFYVKDEDRTEGLTFGGVPDTIDLKGEDWQLYGISQRTSFAEASDDDPYRMMFLSKNKLVYGVHPFNVSPYRAVIRLKNDGSQPAATMRIGISIEVSDDVTALQVIEQKDDKYDMWYDLYGRPRESHQHGLYISKNKKMMVR